MPLSDIQKANFQTLLDAAKNDRLALVECTHAETGEPVAVLAAINFNEGDPEGEYQIVPLAKQFGGDPYEELNPPPGTNDAPAH